MITNSSDMKKNDTDKKIGNKNKETRRISIEDLSNYRLLPPSLQKLISSIYKKVKTLGETHFKEIAVSHQYSLHEVLKKIILSEEKLNDISLQLEKHELAVHTNIVHSGTDTEVYTTDKRLLLVNTSDESRPHLQTHPQIYVHHTEFESFRVISIPFKHVDSIWMETQHKSRAWALISRVELMWLLILGILVSLAGFVFWSMETNEISRLLIIPVGIVLIIIALLLRKYKAEDPKVETEQKHTIHLSVLEPFYFSRANLLMEVKTEVHSLKDTVEWVSLLQDNCKHIV